MARIEPGQPGEKRECYLSAMIPQLGKIIVWC